MAKNNITQYDATAANNTDIDSINIAEGMAASDVNNAIRALMSHLKNMDSGSQALTALSVAGNVTASTSLKTPLIEFTDGDDALTIADGGNVTANANLTVSGAFTSQGIDDNADATAITIDSSENVGIGETSPNGKLNLATGAGTACELRLTSNNTGSGAGDRGRISVHSARNDGTAFEAGKIEIDRSSGTEDRAHILFATNSGSAVTERVRITDSGVVNLGTNGSHSGSIVNSTTGGIDSYRSTTGGGVHHFKSDVGGTNTLKSFINEAGSLDTSSDYRLKKNVVDLPSSLETIKALRPVNFNFTDQTKLQSGFIAHELKEHISHIVDGDKDQVKEDGSMFIQMINYSGLIPHLTKALQEAIAKIEVLETKITALENK